MNKERSARRAWKPAPSVSLLTLPHSGQLPPQDPNVYPPISGAHAQEPPATSCARPHGQRVPRLARPVGCLPPSLLRALMVLLIAFKVRAEAPPRSAPASPSSYLVWVRRARAELVVGLDWEGGGEATITWR